MSKITTIGLDLAKNVFHVVCCDARGKVVRKRKLKRGQVLPFFGNLEQCLVGMEACAGSHHWGRELEALGFEVKLIPARYVKGLCAWQQERLQRCAGDRRSGGAPRDAVCEEQEPGATGYPGAAPYA